MCGEKPLQLVFSFSLLGSPPHVRGKDCFDGLPKKSTGITPACAGKRQGQSVPNGSYKDHPRMCGEKCIKFLIGTLFEGSPPHVRGKVLVPA